LHRLCSLRPRLAIVLGSGFQQVASEVRAAIEIACAELPGFPPTGVAGHAGTLVLGHLNHTPLLLLNGRAHYYEGHSMESVTFPVRVLAAFGIRDLVLTSAAGGINRRWRPGDFVRITDHINFMGVNPLRGPAARGRMRFIDLTRTYDHRLGALLEAAARKVKLRLRSGVYLAVSGPSYETPAEIRAFARLGADAVGMSTVPEAIVARQCGLAVAGLACITNLAAGRSQEPLSHPEVLAAGERVGSAAVSLLKGFVGLYAQAR
jgi:purine-nucleoside phosphorylase